MTAETDAELANLILERGWVVARGSSRVLTYGWKDYKGTEHARECTLAAITVPWCEWWSEFEDTYSENSNHEGIEVKIECVCGTLDNRVMRLEARLRDIMVMAMPADVREERDQF